MVVFLLQRKESENGVGNGDDDFENVEITPFWALVFSKFSSSTPADDSIGGVKRDGDRDI